MNSDSEVLDRKKENRFIGRAELIAALVLSAVVLLCVIVRTLHAGALWRDECDSLQLATMPRFSDLLEHLQFTGFPILFPITVRVYTTLFGTSDTALRCFGLVAALFFLTAAWFEAKSFNRSVPLLVPALIGLNANFLTAGLWLRGYGLGCALLLLAFALTARFLTEPTTRKLVIVFCTYLATMQCLFFNGVLVAAMVVAAATVLLVRREWRWMWMLLGAAALCGFSYLPYVWRIYTSTKTWAVVVQIPFSLSGAAERFVAAVASDPREGILWASIVLLCFIAGLWRLGAIWKADRSAERDLLFFALLVIPIGIVAQFGFLRLMQNIIIPRYYLALMTLISAASTLIIVNITARAWLYFGRPAIIVTSVALILFITSDQLRERNSTIDIISQRLEKEGRPGDLIVLSDAQLGISFNHYYHGPNRWITVPEIEDHRTHRYDLIQKKMMEFFPLEDVEKEVEAALKSRGRVWVIGGKPLRSAAMLAPAPDPEYGWQLPAYIEAWSHQLAEFMRRHASRLELVVRREKDVSQWENPQLVACEGWKY